MSNAVDLAQKLTAATAGNLAKNGVTHVGRYLSRTAWKGLDAAEVSVIKAAGLQIFSIYETNPTYAGYFTVSQGQKDAADAIQLAKAIGQPVATAIYFTVDYDAQPADFPDILAYFHAVSSQLDGLYYLGAYGSYAILNYLHANNAADYYFQTCAWSNGRRNTFLNIYQYQCDKSFAGLQVDLDNFEQSDVGAWGQAVFKTEVVSQPGSPKDYASLTINYPSGYGINAYDTPNGQYVRKVTAGAYRVYSEKDNWYGIGANTWVKGDSSIVTIKRDVVKVNYPKGYGVNVYDAPNGNFTKHVNGGDSYAVYAAVTGWYGIGANCWIKEIDVIVSK